MDRAIRFLPTVIVKKQDVSKSIANAIMLVVDARNNVGASTARIINKTRRWTKLQTNKRKPKQHKSHATAKKQNALKNIVNALTRGQPAMKIVDAKNARMVTISNLQNLRREETTVRVCNQESQIKM